MPTNPEPVNRAIFEQTARSIAARDAMAQTRPTFLKRSELWCGSRTQRRYAFRAVCCTPIGNAAKCRQNSAVAKDFIEGLHPAGRDISLGLGEESVQAPCLDVLP